MDIPKWYTREIVTGMSGPDVDVVRRKLGLSPGQHDRASEDRIKALARKNDVESRGEVNPDVAKYLGESEANRAGLVPVWFKRELGPKDMFSAAGDDVRQLRGRLALAVGDDRYTPEVEDAVRRFQSYHGLLPNGVVDEELAKLIG